MYVKQEANGDIIYSDKPIPATKPVLAPKIVTADKKTKDNKPNPFDTRLIYKKFHITSPLDKEIIQSLTAVLVDLKVEPALQQDDKIQLFIDGKPLGEPSNNTHINTDITEKGLHEIYGILIDKDKNIVMQSNVITINIREAQKDTHKLTKIVTPQAVIARPRSAWQYKKWIAAPSKKRLARNDGPRELPKIKEKPKTIQIIHPKIVKIKAKSKPIQILHPRIVKIKGKSKLIQTLYPRIVKIKGKAKPIQTFHPSIVKIKAKSKLPQTSHKLAKLKTKSKSLHMTSHKIAKLKGKSKFTQTAANKVNANKRA